MPHYTLKQSGFPSRILNIILINYDHSITRGTKKMINVDSKLKGVSIRLAGPSRMDFLLDE